MELNTTEMTVAQIKEAQKELRTEMNRRRYAYLQEMAKAATMTQERADAIADEERVSYEMSIGNWALVELTIDKKKWEMAKEGCVAFWPIINPQPETPEYIELFKEGK